MNRVIVSESFDPHYNLALEEYLTAEACSAPTLYLWQNANTVVIGRNQNALKECRTSLLESEGGKLARRTTGGGAVYHDLGNLNFSFIAPNSVYDVRRQLSMICSAVSQFALELRISGRNDLATISGAKCSGNAFRNGTDCSLHHGTLLVNADLERMTRYLTPSPAKLQARGVDSVRSRVVNLAQLCSVNVAGLKSALVEAYKEEYGEYEAVDPAAFSADELSLLREKHGSESWLYGSLPYCNIELEQRFSWGDASLVLHVSRNVIQAAALYTDALDCEAVESINKSLIGCSYRAGAIDERLSPLSPMARDIAELIKRCL